MNYKTKSFMTKKKAFTLIELLIVIAIIGILFIVLVSKVDFATDKAKATGVQTDFRSFQVAFDTVAKENAGFNTFGWDTGDANQNGKRDSYDEGDANKDGIRDAGEVWTGHKVYNETFTKVFSLKKNGTGDYDREALNRLETAINANLDPKLHITIKDDGEIVMANGARDPWNKEYHGWYITNAEVDKKDRGAIIMYSDGANNTFGSEHKIANGVVSISIPGNNKNGKDDYSIVSCYTYLNGYGEVLNMTTGFSNNQSFLGNNIGMNNNVPIDPSTPNQSQQDPYEKAVPGLYTTGAINAYLNGDVDLALSMLTTKWEDLLSNDVVRVENGVVFTKYNDNEWANDSENMLQGDLILPNDGSIVSLGEFSYDEWEGNPAFIICNKLTGIVIPSSVRNISDCAFYECEALETIEYMNNSSLKTIGKYAFYHSALKAINIPDSVTHIGFCSFEWCERLETVHLPSSLSFIDEWMFYDCPELTSINIPDKITMICDSAFEDCPKLEEIVVPTSVHTIAAGAFAGCTNLKTIVIPDNIKNIESDVFIGTAWLTIQQQKNPLVIVNDILVDGTTCVGDVVIPSNVIEISAHAFKSCTSITSVDIPASVKKIGLSAFNGCSNLSGQVTLTGVETLEDWAFSNCSQINTVVLSNAIKEIPDSAFSKCQSLVNINLPESLIKIGDYAFKECNSLISIAIPNNITTIGYQSFMDCKGLTNLTLGTSLSSIANSAFSGCTSLQDVVIPNSVETIEYHAFYRCTSLATLSLGNSVKSIENRAFYQCTSLTSVVIPNSITKIEAGIFQACTALRDISYAGTKDQWSAVSLGSAWCSNAPTNYVQCSDGQVSVK